MKSHQLINQTSGKVEYYTPQFIIEAARATMGGIDLDPASSIAANQNVMADKIFTINDNGLAQSWFGRVWMNHPFNKKTNRAWIDKLETEYESGRVTEAVCITFASTSEKWFQPLLKRPQCFFSSRTNYLDENGNVVKGVSKGSCTTYFGENESNFYKAFRTLGIIKTAYSPKTA